MVESNYFGPYLSVDHSNGKQETEHKQSTVGDLYLIGGHEDKENEYSDILCTIASTIADQGKIAVVTQASRHYPKAVLEDYRMAFCEILNEDARLSHEQVIGIDNTKKTPNIEEVADDVDAIYLGGGDQELLDERLGEEGKQAIKGSYHDGTTVVGTSAGAHHIPEYEVVGHYDGSFEIKKGIGLTKKIFVDTHINERAGRYQRTMQAIIQITELKLREMYEQSNKNNGNQEEVIIPLAFALDADTAIKVRDDRWVEVIGSGNVTVFDALPDQNTTEGEAPLKAWLLSVGDRFDLDTRKQIVKTTHE